MEYSTTFNPQIDIQEFQPNLALNLDVNLNNLVIKDTGVVSVDNGIDSNSRVMQIIGDPFEAMEAKSFLAKHATKSNETTTKTNQSSQPSNG